MPKKSRGEYYRTISLVSQVSQILKKKTYKRIEKQVEYPLVEDNFDFRGIRD